MTLSSQLEALGKAGTQKGHAMNKDELLAPGQVQWYSSEEESGPDVGILVGLGDGKELWIGEMVNSDGVGPVGLAIFHGQRKCEARSLDFDSLRDVIEYHVAPALRALAERGE